MRRETKRNVWAALSAGTVAALVGVACDQPVSPEASSTSPGLDGPQFHVVEPAQCGVMKSGTGLVDWPPNGKEPPQPPWKKNPRSGLWYATFGERIVDANGDCVPEEGHLNYEDNTWLDTNNKNKTLLLRSKTFTSVGFVPINGECKKHPGFVLRAEGVGHVRGHGDFNFVTLQCDNDGGENDGFEIYIPNEESPQYAVRCPERRGMSPPLCRLKGGNIDIHPPPPAF